jgi:hypothetical protein
VAQLSAVTSPPCITISQCGLLLKPVGEAKMQRKTFRFIIAICAAWAALSIPSLVAILLPAIQVGDVRTTEIIFSVVGFALLPIATVGLWHERLWGFICLLFGLLCVLLVHPTASYLHGVCFVVTLVRYFLPRDEACTVRE